MFLLTRNFLLLPITFLIWCGLPFKFDLGSNLRNFSVADIKKVYIEKRKEHYAERFIVLAFVVILLLVAIGATVISGGLFLAIIPVVLLVFISIDGFMLLGRYLANRHMHEVSKDSNELVPANYWKDTSLDSLLTKRQAAIDLYVEEYEKRTGRKPTNHDIQYGY